jgi:hypothetical protein
VIDLRTGDAGTDASGTIDELDDVAVIQDSAGPWDRPAERRDPARPRVGPDID